MDRSRKLFRLALVTFLASVTGIPERGHAQAPIHPASSLSQSAPAENGSILGLMDNIRAESNQAMELGPQVYQSWWDSMVGGTMRQQTAFPVSVNTLLLRALEHSAQIDTFRELPLIRETAITEARSAFDWTRYAETFWNDLNEPVGSTLTTGGPNRLNDHHWTGAAGLRRTNQYGGQVDVSQQLGHQNTNSVFFVPQDQGTARLSLSYTQPLMRGHGQAYNTSLIVLAKIDTNVAFEELSRQLQSHLLEVTRSYWGVYLERASLLQKIRLYLRTQEIVDHLESRQALDASQAQLVRARAALAARKAELLRAEAAIQNAEARIRALVNDPSMNALAGMELIPTEAPTATRIPMEVNDCIALALQQRPEIRQSMKQIQAASVRCNMAKNEIQPLLNLVARSYVAGLQGHSDVGQAWVDQFSVGAPSYSLGLQYEIPIGNRQANARLQRRRLEIRQLESQYRATAETVSMEVEVAFREVETSFRELAVKHQAMQAAEQEYAYIYSRWRNLTSDTTDASLMMDNLLRAQERVTESESEFLHSQMAYSLSLMNLKRADGSLLQSEEIDLERYCENGLPRLTNESPLLSAEPPIPTTDLGGELSHVSSIPVESRRTPDDGFAPTPDSRSASTAADPHSGALRR